RDRQVALDGKRPDPFRLALEDLPPSREHRDVGALGGESLCDRETYAERCAAHDRSTAGEREFHRAEGYPGRCSGPVKCAELGGGRQHAHDLAHRRRRLAGHIILPISQPELYDLLDAARTEPDGDAHIETVDAVFALE